VPGEVRQQHLVPLGDRRRRVVAPLEPGSELQHPGLVPLLALATPVEVGEPVVEGALQPRQVVFAP
jgi:hypothetical protein